MLAIGRALMSNPRVLLMDEPSEGLAPQIVAEVMATIRRLKEEGLSIVLVEQNAKLVFDIADDIVILNSGRVVVADRRGPRLRATAHRPASASRHLLNAVAGEGSCCFPAARPRRSGAPIRPEDQARRAPALHRRYPLPCRDARGGGARSRRFDPAPTRRCCTSPMPRPRAVNRKQQETHLRPLTSSRRGSRTWTAPASTSRRSRPRPASITTGPSPAGAPDRAPHQREHRRDLPRPSRPLRRPRHRAAAGAGARRAELERAVKDAGPARRRDLHQRAGEELSAERFRRFFAKAQELDILIFMHPSGFTDGRRLARSLLHQRHRQSARLDGGGDPSHLRRRARGLSAAQDRASRMAAASSPAYSGRIDHAHRRARGLPARDQEASRRAI